MKKLIIYKVLLLGCIAQHSVVTASQENLLSTSSTNPREDIQTPAKVFSSRTTIFATEASDEMDFLCEQAAHRSRIKKKKEAEEALKTAREQETEKRILELEKQLSETTQQKKEAEEALRAFQKEKRKNRRFSFDGDLRRIKSSPPVFVKA